MKPEELHIDLACLHAQALVMRRPVVSVRTVAALFMVDERTVRRAIELGQLRAQQLGDKTLIATAPLREALGIEYPSESSDEDLDLVEELLTQPSPADRTCPPG
jgi:hypothetical protein